jgi:hypothetical protein
MSEISPQHAQSWPELPREAWKDTRDTLHMWTQVVGKVRLALAPPEPQWGHVPLYVTSRGLTTTPIPHGELTFSIEFDFIDHALVVQVSDGRRKNLALGPKSVARFYREVMDTLRSLGIAVAISPRPKEIPNPIPFLEDERHASYDPVWVNRYWQVLTRIDIVFKQHRARFSGRSSPVSFYWGTFDLSYTRYSGRPAEPPPGSDVIYRLGMNVECFELGFWPGDDRFPEPAFFAFAYPKPKGIEIAKPRPAEASWSEPLGEFVLRYADVRRATSPSRAILEFAESTYRAAAALAGWDVAALDAPQE